MLSEFSTCVTQTLEVELVRSKGQTGEILSSVSLSAIFSLFPDSLKI